MKRSQRLVASTFVIALAGCTESGPGRTAADAAGGHGPSDRGTKAEDETAPPTASERWVGGTPVFVFDGRYRRAHPVSGEIRAGNRQIPADDDAWTPWVVEVPRGVTLDPAHAYRVKAIVVEQGGTEELATLRIEAVAERRRGGPEPEVIPGIGVAGLRLDRLEGASLEGVDVAPFVVSHGEIAFSSSDVGSFRVGAYGTPPGPSVSDILTTLRGASRSQTDDAAPAFHACETTQQADPTVYDCGGLRVSTPDPEGHDATVIVHANDVTR